mgnify:FL=1|jgi:Pyruvate/2-oxoacid:ferredoxin oxidoreductase gamma subunit|tara:strand:- start:620 stop:955 length:336 start_codon:yes stop_codon:yes gene_type:complete
MLNYLTHKYDKPWYRQSEMLLLTAMSESCLRRYMADQRKAGLPLADMGYLKFEGFKEVCWQPGLFTHWLITNKLEAEVKYDYELAEQKKVRMNVVNLNKQQSTEKGAINEH